MKMPDASATVEAITVGICRHYQYQELKKIPDGMHNLYDKQALIDLLEEAAITAWNHYMDACKKAAINPSTKEQFLAASAIRKLKETL